MLFIKKKQKTILVYYVNGSRILFSKLIKSYIFKIKTSIKLEIIKIMFINLIEVWFNIHHIVNFSLLNSTCVMNNLKKMIIEISVPCFVFHQLATRIKQLRPNETKESNIPLRKQNVPLSNNPATLATDFTTSFPFTIVQDISTHLARARFSRRT